VFLVNIFFKSEVEMPLIANLDFDIYINEDPEDFLDFDSLDIDLNDLSMTRTIIKYEMLNYAM